ncbi:aarF domain-containing kinase 1 [Anopheles merus]|uniref:Protein kinase domain-containing protein n=1 Tax=Anopheles merus TaxID=30066 RepID=A0A182V7L8_ANOME|nr:aarF domain-containing kinase 1 [Anopheles merus]XP_041784093.1 aarF domain-containing kinase 1 [Anopheles merus]XP_041784094.1 aarF domain-containing kinase 1 [Anopheles merus]
MSFRRALKYGVVGSAVLGTGLSLHANDYDINSVGIVRLGRAGATVFDIATTYQANLYSREWADKKSAEYLQVKSDTHRAAAERLLELCRTNRGVYIKVGQHIGALEYLLPAEYVSTMKVLHSNAPQNPVEDLYRVIRQDLRVDPSDLFESFDPEPLGTASLAQVHRATLKDGREVAVKVQHPYVKGNSIVDIKTMEVLVKLVAWTFPDFKFQWLVDESKRNLPMELDFANEGRNAEKVREMFRHYRWLKIPGVIWEYTTPRVLMMEYTKGGQVNDLEYIQREKLDPYDIANKIGQLYSNMIFLKGFVHSDPHPGNILVRRGEQNGGTEIVLLDHGLYADLTEKFRYNYSKLWLSILRVDQEGMKKYAQALGVEGSMWGLFACMVTGRPWNSVIHGVDKVKQDDAEKEMIQNEGKLVLPHISDVLEKVDRQMLLVLKTNDLIRGIETTLRTQNRMTAFWVMSKCCVKSIGSQEYLTAGDTWSKLTTCLREQWCILKLNLYYLYRGLVSLHLLSALKMIF